MQPEAAARRVRAALEQLDLWPAASHEQQALTDGLLRYVSLLERWNRTYNLTAVRDPRQMLVQHVFDSAAVVGPLRDCVEAHRAQQASKQRPSVVDVGSGAGLPGIVLALLWRDADVLLVEPVAKKAAFLQQVISELALANASVARERVQDLASDDADAPSAIVCRAFASLDDYVRAVAKLAGPHTVVAAMKARLDEAEKSALTPEWRIAKELPLQVPELDARRSLVVLERAASAAGTGDDAARPRQSASPIPERRPHRKAGAQNQ